LLSEVSRFARVKKRLSAAVKYRLSAEVKQSVPLIVPQAHFTPSDASLPQATSRFAAAEHCIWKSFTK